MTETDEQPKQRRTRRPAAAVTPAETAPPKRAMSDAHKQALADGRNHGRAVRQYLEALEAFQPKRGRPQTTESIQRRLDAVEEGLATASSLDRLLLLQKRIELRSQLEAMEEPPVPMEELEAAFVKSVGPYSDSKGISYFAWREAGVSAAVLKQAGVRRS